jgi:NO-binding membrane sensor protein with MHYT domain
MPFYLATVFVTASVALLACRAALDMLSRYHADARPSGAGWLAGAAGAMGGGTWVANLTVNSVSRAHSAESFDYEGLGTTLELSCVVAFVVLAAMRLAPPRMAGVLLGLSVFVPGMLAFPHPFPLLAGSDWRFVTASLAVSLILGWASMRRSDGTAEGIRRSSSVLLASVACIPNLVLFIFGGSHLPAAHVGDTRAAMLVETVVGSVLVLATCALVAEFARRLSSEAEGRFAEKSLAVGRYRAAPACLLTLDFDWNVIDASDACLRMLGVDRSEVVARTFDHFVTAETCIAGRAAREKVLADGRTVWWRCIHNTPIIPN